MFITWDVVCNKASTLTVAHALRHPQEHCFFHAPKRDAVMMPNLVALVALEVVIMPPLSFQCENNRILIQS